MIFHKPPFIGFIFFLFGLGLSWNGFAQTFESDERALLKVEDGISFSKDSLFLMNLRFRMQNRAGFNTFGGDDFGVEEYEMRVRRMRLRFDGFVGTKKLQYYIQLGFSKADMDLENSQIAQPLRDAIVYYFLTPNFYLGFGQSKLPGNRQRVTSSGNLQFADRSLANGFFNIDRDFGFFAYKTFIFKNQSALLAKGVISTGDGRNATKTNDGLAYTGRLEYLPFGAFKNVGDYSEGDLEFEPKPRLSVGVSYSANIKAVRTGGQLGPVLFDQRNIYTLIVDGVFKYQGWAVLGEFFSRDANDPITYGRENEIRYVTVGNGFNLQVSRMLGRKSELAFRYSAVQPREDIISLQNRTEESILGYSYYIRKHRIKLQGNAGYKWLEGLPSFENTGNSFTGTFQVEFGI
jgi:phosphate-selective porin OprO and OprP